MIAIIAEQARAARIRHFVLTGRASLDPLGSRGEHLSGAYGDAALSVSQNLWMWGAFVDTTDTFGMFVSGSIACVARAASVVLADVPIVAIEQLLVLMELESEEQSLLMATPEILEALSECPAWVVKYLGHVPASPALRDRQ